MGTAESDLDRVEEAMSMPVWKRGYVSQAGLLLAMVLGLAGCSSNGTWNLCRDRLQPINPPMHLPAVVPDHA